MAAPVVSGSVALIRQYYTDGFYPGGAKNDANQYKPSGPLIKATLLGGAANMLGNTEAGLPLEPAPSFKQGFGRVNLTRSLPLKDGGWRMQVRGARWALPLLCLLRPGRPGVFVSA
jgi:hypothetical protein